MKTEFREIVRKIIQAFDVSAQDVKVGHWQGIVLDVKKLPNFQSHEVFNHSFVYDVKEDLDFLRREIKPNLPWADDHFLERVGGEPLNPGNQYKNWPFYFTHADQEGTFRKGGQFTHTYMERFWTPPRPGLRYPFGNLDDVIALLVRQPFTRQAYFPIWFPEDTGASHKGRVPCTLGYQFMRRGDRLHIFYILRSCDLLRHFQDDVYMAARLLIWVLGELRKRDPDWGEVSPGQLIMHIFSLHVFKGETDKIWKLWNQFKRDDES